MLYFKNSDLTSTYRIALNTVLNWMKAAQRGKLGLELTKVGERYYIANTANNVALIERLVEERKKYRNSRTSRTITPQPRFYELFNEKHIVDIISNLDIHRELPLQYSYFADGAEYWDGYATRMSEDKSPNLLTRTIKLLEVNAEYIDDIIAKHKLVNIVDIGPGNAMPVRALLARLQANGVLNKYIAVDISPGILEIARKNIATWFDGAIDFEGHLADITQDRIGQILAAASRNDQDVDVINIVLFLGGTICNFRGSDAAQRIIQQSMNRQDIFIHTSKLDTLQSRRFFDFSSSPGKTSLFGGDRMLLDLLNLDPAWYEVEMGFDSTKNQRFIQVRLLVAVRIDFRVSGGVRRVLLEKGDSILLWRFWQQNSAQATELLINCGFYPLHVSQSDDMEYILIISRIRTEAG